MRARDASRRLRRMGGAGGSARAEYERRRARDRAQIRGNLGQRIAVLAATPILVFVALRFGAPWALDSFFDVLANQAESGEPITGSSTEVDTGTWTIPAVVLAVAA